MSKPIQVLYLIKRKESWYQLSYEEKNIIGLQTLEATVKAGGKRLTICDSTWSSGECEFFELTEFPNLSAIQQRIDFYEQAEMFRYYEISTVLGFEMTKTRHDDIQGA